MIDHAAVLAAVRHGQGRDALESLRDTLTENVALRAAMVFELAAADVQLPHQPVVDGGRALMSALLSDEPHDTRAVFEDRSFKTWLADAERSLGQGPERAVAALARLGWVVIDRATSLPSAWGCVAVPDSTRVAAMALVDEFIVGSASNSLAEVVVADHGFRVSTADGSSVTVAAAEGGLAVKECHGFRRAPRRRTLFGIEVLEPDAFPELQRIDVDSGTPLRATRDPIDGPLAAALELIATVWPEAIDDIVATIRAIVPLVASGSQIYNTSSGQTPGVVQLTIRRDEDPFRLAETIIHEAAHVKLDALWDVQPLLVGSGGLFQHPWLPELRPLRGALLGTQAFLNVAEFDRRALDLGLDEDGYVTDQYPQHRQELDDALDLVSHNAELSPLGHTVVEELTRAVSEV